MSRHRTQRGARGASRRFKERPSATGARPRTWACGVHAMTEPPGTKRGGP